MRRRKTGECFRRTSTWLPCVSPWVSEKVATAEPLPEKSNFVSREHLMTIIANTGNFMTCDFQQAYSFGWITSALASDADICAIAF